MPLTSKELNALIHLLDDPDEHVFDQVSKKLQSLGTDAIPALEEAWEHQAYGILFQSRVESLIHQIQLDLVKTRLSEWSDSTDKPLLEGLILIARYQYPDLDVDSIYSFFDQLEKDIWLELHDGLTALEKLKVINHLIFDVYHFKGNVDNYLAPDNSYINKVIETRSGNPISMAIVYILMAKRLELPIYGVNLPRHFILAWGDEMSQMTNKDHNDPSILFYINPFSSGAIFSREDISAFLKEIKLKPNPIFFLPCTNYDIILRTLNNLANSYNQNKQPEKAEDIRELQRAMLRDSKD